MVMGFQAARPVPGGQAALVAWPVSGFSAPPSDSLLPPPPCGPPKSPLPSAPSVSSSPSPFGPPEPSVGSLRPSRRPQRPELLRRRLPDPPPRVHFLRRSR